MSRSPPSNGPRWYWDSDSRQRYFYDERTDCLHFENGVVAPRPARIPRTSFTSAASQTPASGGDYGQGSRHYSTSSHSAPSQPVNTPSASRSSTSAGPSYSQYPQPRQPVQSLDEVTEAFGRAAIQNQAQQPRATQYNPAPIQATVQEQGAERRIYVADPRTRVRTWFQESPADQITDPFLLRSGIQARRRLLAPDENLTEALFDSYRRRNQPKKFFTIGKVFLVLWVEPAGESVITNFEPGTTLGSYGERVFSKVRRFVVIREGADYCTCLPIVSYGKQGVGKKGVNKSEHSIIYTGKQPPDPLPAELPVREEIAMRKEAIRIDVDDPVDKLDNVSRLDYGKVYTIQHNIKVKKFGKVNPNSMNALVHQFGNVWNSRPVISMASTLVASLDASNAARARARRQSNISGPSRNSVDSGSADGNSKNAGNRTSGATTGPSPQQDRASRTQAALRQLIEHGYTEEQAVAALRAFYHKQSLGTQVEQDDGDQDEDDEDEDDEDEDEEDEDEDEAGDDQGSEREHGKARSSTHSKGSKDKGKDVATKSRSSHTGSMSARSSQPRPTPPSYAQHGRVATAQPPGSSQTGSGRATGPGQSQASGSRAPSVASAQAQAQAQAQAEAQAAQAYMMELINRGYKQEDANEMVRARFGSRKRGN